MPYEADVTSSNPPFFFLYGHVKKKLSVFIGLPININVPQD